MIAEIAACLPDSLSAYGDRLARGPGGPGARPVAALRERARFDAVLDTFEASLPALEPAVCAPVDRRALASYWSQYYLATLVTPALAAWLRLGRVLPVTLDGLAVEMDAACLPARFLLPETPCARAAAPATCRAALVEGHLRPLCALCHAHAGLSPRVFWGNAAVIVDYVARELAFGCPLPCALQREVADLLGPGPEASSPLGDALGAAGPDGVRRRRVCCLRYRLPGVPSCGGLCPVAACQKKASSRAC